MQGKEGRVRELRELAKWLRMLSGDPAQKPSERDALIDTASKVDAEADRIEREGE